jgi:hypothetical protein
LCFQFTDIRDFCHWWLICRDGETDLCTEDPGKDVDCYVTGTSRDLIAAWMGDIPLAKALKADRIHLIGERHLCRTFSRWFALSAAAQTPRPTSAERRAGAAGS